MNCSLTALILAQRLFENFSDLILRSRIQSQLFIVCQKLSQSIYLLFINLLELCVEIKHVITYLFVDKPVINLLIGLSHFVKLSQGLKYRSICYGVRVRTNYLQFYRCLIGKYRILAIVCVVIVRVGLCYKLSEVLGCWIIEGLC